MALPFGWCLAPYAYTKFTRPIVAAMRSPGLARAGSYSGRIGALSWVANDYYIQIYIDDILIMSTTPDRLRSVI